MYFEVAWNLLYATNMEANRFVCKLAIWQLHESSIASVTCKTQCSLYSISCWHTGIIVLWYICIVMLYRSQADLKRFHVIKESEIYVYIKCNSQQLKWLKTLYKVYCSMVTNSLKVVRHWLPVSIMCNLGRDFGEAEVTQSGIFLEEE